MYATRGLREDMSIVIRTASDEDAAAVRAIALASGIDAWTIDHYRHEAGGRDAVFLVAEDGSKIIGFISGRVVPSTIEGADGEIYNIAVSQEIRGKGTGRYLLANAIDQFNSAGCRSIWLEVRESNLAAIQFYENNGFSRVTTRRNFYSGPVESAIVMRLTLIE
jgi:[ribosomal protein S18]-alanine N-acetyltransferase